MTHRSPVGGPAPRVFEGVVFPPSGQPTNGLPITTVDDGEQGRDLSDMVLGLDGKRVRVTVEVLLKPPTERPILFSAPMVRAVLEGKKTQTRRVVKLPLAAQHDVAVWRISRPLPTDHAFECWRFEETTGRDRKSLELRCPFGRAGDRLWVKEGLRRGDWEGMPEGSVLYAADDSPAWDLSRPCVWGWKPKTLPSMYCPRGLSRITLEVTGVRVDRLKYISDEDATAEGCPAGQVGSAKFTARDVFAIAWDQINGDGAWDANPWVWVVEFRRVEP